MSRSALERQAFRSARSGTLPVPSSAPAGFLSEVDEQRAEERQREEEARSNVLPIHGNDRTFNLNTLLAQTILASEYFKGLAAITTYLEVVDEIYSYCDHVAPWAPGTSRVPSSAFCLLMKLFVMKLTRPQMNEILVHEDSPFIRAIGFLYLRYTCPPKELWGWLEPYMDDEEEFKPSPTEGNMTMGQFVRKIISDMQYYGTMLPRIPVLIERKMKVQLLLHEEMKKREKANFRIVNQLKPGTKIRAIYADEENDPSWYDAVINSVEEDNRYWVTFPEYGNQELVRLGSIMLQAKTDKSPTRGSGSRGGEIGDNKGSANGGSDRKRSRSDSRSRRGGSRDRDRDRDSRDRDRDRDRGGRDRDRGGRDRGRDRDGSRDRDRAKDKGRRRSRSRSRDRDGRHRRTSRDRDRGSGSGRSRDGGRRDSRDRDRGGGGRGRSRSDSRDRSSRRDRDRDGRRDGGGGSSIGGGVGAKPAAAEEDDMSSSLLDMDPSNLYAQVMKREREASQAVGKDYAARPVSYKGSLSLKLDRYTQRRKSRSRSPERPRGSGGGGGRGGRDERRAEPSPPRRKAAPVITAEELRRQEELKKRYGDASASKR
eukprot:g17178.t1